MTTTASAIVQRIQTVVAAQTGLDAEHVIRGRPASLAEGPTPPVVWIAASRVTGEYGSDLTSYTYKMFVDIIVVAPATSDSYGDREDASFDLVSTLCAVADDTTLLSYLIVPPLVVAEAQLEGLENPGLAVVGLSIECRWLKAIGSGI